MKGQPCNRNSSGTPSWRVGRGMWPQVWPLQPDAGPVTQTKLTRAMPLVPLAGMSRGRPQEDPRVRRARFRPFCGDRHPTALQPRGTEGPFLVRGWGWSPAQGRHRRPHSTEGQGLSPRSGGLLPWDEERQRTETAGAGNMHVSNVRESVGSALLGGKASCAPGLV